MLKPKIILTGACGMIGSVLLKQLNDRGINDVLLVDNMGKADKWKNLYGLKFNDIILPGELLDMIERNDTVLQDIDVVFHIGACSSTTETDVDYLLVNNVHYSQELALWAIERSARFIFASSAATYGSGENGFNDDEALLDSLRPLNAYGFSKHLFDLWSARHGLFKKIVSLKYFNVFGPNEYHKGPMRSMALKGFEQIQKEGKVRLFKSYKKEYKDGEQQRDFIYVKDAVRASLFFIDNREASGIFNIGTGNPRTWNDMMRSIFKAVGKEEKIEYIDMPEQIKGQYQYHTKSEIEKLRRAGFKEEFMSLEESIEDYIKNYLIGHKYIGD